MSSSVKFADLYETEEVNEHGNYQKCVYAVCRKSDVRGPSVWAHSIIKDLKSDL